MWKKGFNPIFSTGIPSPRKPLPTLPIELIILIFQFALQRFSEDDFTSNCSLRKLRYKTLLGFSYSSKALYHVVKPFLLQYVWIQTKKQRAAWKNREIKSRVGTLVLKFSELDQEMEEILNRCKTVNRLELLDAPPPSESSRSPEGELPPIQVDFRPLRTESEDRKFLPVFKSRLTSLEVEDLRITAMAYQAMIWSLKSKLRSLTANLKDTTPDNINLFTEFLNITLPHLEELKLSFWEAVAAQRRPFMNAVNLTTLTLNYNPLFVKVGDWAAIFNTLAQLPPDNHLRELRIGHLEVAKMLLQYGDFHLLRLDKLERLLVDVGSYGTLSFPTFPVDLAGMCAKRKLQVVTVDPFGEERHVAPVPESQRAPRWTRQNRW